MNISKQDVGILRELGRKAAELSATDDNKQKIDKWTRLTDLDKSAGPLQLIHLWPLAWAEALPDEQHLVCQNETARNYERDLRQRIWSVENLHDDTVIEPVIRYPHCVEITAYPELPVMAHYASDDHAKTGAFKFESPIVEMADIEKIGDPVVKVDAEQREGYKAEAEEIFGGILDVIPTGIYFAAKVVDEWAGLRGMENVYTDMMDESEWTHEALQRIADNFQKRFQTLEEQGLWGPWEKSDPLGSTGLRFNPDIPNYQDIMKKGKADLMDTWAFTCAEGFNCVSPGMHEEFDLPYNVQLMKLFKWVNVGCCEVLHNKVEFVKNVPNVRRISVSEWCDFEKAGAEIGTELLYGYKPSGVPFLGDGLHEDQVRKELRRVLDAAKDCPLEMILNIGGTLGGGDGAAKLVEWTKIAKEEIEATKG
ncbi:hypothetical protein PDESU_01337 [Pontiella desulfatans]|uniref:Uroporphyrinogen decarboxylase (URO-D) domain-containing protein n=1 Tax=Pontiella desulfatans TaxID=2750659 RepID=A0A6C2TYU7_PONDE|nr:hypothetical protein [Pontiella desulfatans]VGO12783.1 hypothetical protein PDESU_01337 [Pontiella desulfatans]